MKGHWDIVDHHIALRCEGRMLHPCAQEIYAVLNGDSVESLKGVEFASLKEDLKGVKFSYVGAPLCIVLSNGNPNDILFQLNAKIKGKNFPVDIIQGEVVDQIIADNTWHYVSSHLEEVQNILHDFGIKSNGAVSFSTYLRLIKLIYNDDYDFIINEVSNEKLIPEPSSYDLIPSELNAKLYPYQETGYKWLKFMIKECKGCILGDEMGLGKTIQVIALILSLKSEGSMPVLVVAPISLLENWRRECQKFAPSLKTYILHGSSRISNYRDLLKYDLIITSYSTAMMDLGMINMIDWKLVILDEAQNIKNPSSGRTKCCKSIKRESSIAITGTPFENHVSDIWSLTDFVLPGILGSINEYKRVVSDDVSGGAKIEPILSPLLLRRTVKEVAKDLPEKVISAQPIPMSESECDGYTKCLEDINNSKSQDNINLFDIQKLRMYCTHPFLVDGTTDKDPAAVSIKYTRLCEILEEIFSRNEKVLIFTSYIKMFDILKEDLSVRFGKEIWTINGATPVDERQTIVDKFNEKRDSAILILNPVAAGTGLNITGANHVIHYNPEWNPALEDQASARAYRRGQQKTVFIYRLYYKDTVEQIINERLERKREIATTAIIGNTGINQDKQDILKAIRLIPTKSA